MVIPFLKTPGLPKQKTVDAPWLMLVTALARPLPLEKEPRPPLEENVVPGALLAHAPLLGEQINAFAECSVVSVVANKAVPRMAIIVDAALLRIKS